MKPKFVFNPDVPEDARPANDTGTEDEGDIVIDDAIVAAIRRKIASRGDSDSFKNFDPEALRNRKLGEALRDFPQIRQILHQVLVRAISVLSHDVAEIMTRCPDFLRLQGLRPDLFRNEEETVILLKKMADWLLTHHPHDVGILTILAEAMLKIGDKKEAENLYVEAALMNPHSAPAFYALAKFLFSEKKNLSVAKRYLDRAFELDPKNAHIAVLRAHVTRRLGDADQEDWMKLN